jgi:hypothetical protein
MALDGFPVVPRIRNFEVRRIDEDTTEVTFETRLFLVNKTYCIETLYNQRSLSSLPIYWMVAESGAYNISNHLFMVGTSPIYRVDETFSAYNNIKIPYPIGCLGEPDAACGFPADVPINAISVITQIQTFLYETYLLVRGISIERRSFVAMLSSHDSFEETYFRLINPNETIGYMAFEAGIQLNCAEKITLQTFASINDVSSAGVSIPFIMDYIRPPGVFGMLNSLVGRDSVGLRVFETTRTSVSFLAQEDQCVDEEMLHTEMESASLLIIGAPTDFIGGEEDVCGVVYNDYTCIQDITGPPTPSATLLTIYGYSDIKNVSRNAITSVVGRAAILKAVLLDQSPYINPGDADVSDIEQTTANCSLAQTIADNYSNAGLIVPEDTTRMFWSVPFIVEKTGFNSVDETLQRFSDNLSDNVADGDFIATIRNYEWNIAGSVLATDDPVDVYCFYSELLYTAPPTQQPVRRSVSHNPIDTPYFIPVVVPLAVLMFCCILLGLVICCMHNRKLRRMEQIQPVVMTAAPVAAVGGRVTPEDEALDGTVAARIKRRGLGV